MDKKGRIYEPPRAKIYRFDDNDQILTDSNVPGGGGSATEPTAEYAANALNQLFGGTNTTIE